MKFCIKIQVEEKYGEWIEILKSPTKDLETLKELYGGRLPMDGVYTLHFDLIEVKDGFQMDCYESDKLSLTGKTLDEIIENTQKKLQHYFSNHQPRTGNLVWEGTFLKVFVPANDRSEKEFIDLKEKEEE